MEIVLALIAFVGFHQWLQHHRRVLVHKERMLAIEKGVDLPVVEQEAKKSSWNVQRLLLLAGLIWVAIGAGGMLLLTALLSYPNSEAVREIPPGMQWVGVIPIGIGLAHLVTFWVGERRGRA
jgi:hypothetical protein